MKTKVTISLDEAFAKRAKKYVKSINQTLSKEITEALEERMRHAEEKKKRKLEIVEELAGSIHFSKEWSVKSLDELRSEALKEKYGLK